MRDSKSLFLLISVLILISISFVLISIWGYRFYYKDKKKPAKQAVENPALINPNATKDSLQILYNATLQRLNEKQDTVFDNDSLTKTLDNKIAQYNTLKSEIAGILKNKTSVADMIIAREKIIELQQKVDQLRNKTDAVAQENIRLNKLVKQLINERTKVSRKTKNITMAPKAFNKKNNSLSFAVSDLNLTAISIDNDKAAETTLASQTDKLQGSFYVKNNLDEIKSTEIEVVILQPNGKVLLNSAWESGTFETPSGTKTYSVKIHFDDSKGENKKLNFSLSASRFQKGNYTMQIYHKGIMVGRMVKTLS